MGLNNSSSLTRQQIEGLKTGIPSFWKLIFSATLSNSCTIGSTWMEWKTYGQARTMQFMLGCLTEAETLCAILTISKDPLMPVFFGALMLENADTAQAYLGAAILCGNWAGLETISDPFLGTEFHSLQGKCNFRNCLEW